MLRVDRRRTARRSRTASTILLVALAITVGLVSASRATAETRFRDVELNPVDVTDLIDLDNSTWLSVVNRLVPDSLPIRVPGLDDLGPVSIPDSEITIARPGDLTDLADGWAIRFEGSAAIDFDGDGAAPPRTVSLTIQAEWESEADDTSPVVDVRLSAPGPVTVAELTALGGKLVAGVELAETIAETAVSGLALEFHWESEASGGRTWFDATGTVTIRAIAFGLLFSADTRAPLGSTGPIVLTGLRADSTHPGADRVSLAEVFGGEWGGIAARLELPEFLVAKVWGLEEGSTFSRSNLRKDSIPKGFFEDCGEGCERELPQELELDGELSLLARIDLASLGDVVADAFQFGDDSNVDLYGKLGFDFSALEDEAATVDLTSVSLKAEVPESGGVNALLPDWLSVGTWTLTVDWSLQAPNDGITFGAETTVDVDVAGEVDLTFDPASVTFTLTDDGTISVGAALESEFDWNEPFGLGWLQLDDLGLGFSFTRAANGETAFDAALTSTFALCAQYGAAGNCDQSTDGLVEARLGVASTTAAEFRIALGENDTGVPVGAALQVVADQFGAPPELGDTLGDLFLEDFALAVSIDTAGEVTFETFGRATLPVFGNIPIAGYLYVEAGDATTPRFFFGARSEGLSLGEILAPNAGDPAPPAALADIALPSLGIVAAPVGGFEASASDLSQDGYEFFKGLYGCAEDAADASDCAFEVDLDPGVNLVANIAFPDGEVWLKLAQLLWLDPATGIQFQGTLSLPGLFEPGGDVEVGLGLRLTLPRLDPGDTVEFIEDGAITLGIEATVGDNPRIAVFVRGELNTRWRRGDEPVPAGGSCLVGTLMKQYENPASLADYEADPELDVPPEGIDPSWCYDRLTFGLESELSLEVTGLTVSLLGSLSSDEGWQHPFGLPGFEWLVINDLRLKLEMVLNSSGNVTINAGFLGDIEIDNGDPLLDNTVLSASFGAGATFQPVPPPVTLTVVPSFKGIRAYVSRIGMADVALLQETLFPASTGVVDVSGLPDIEFQNVELMVAIDADPDLCLEPRFGIAGELWIDPVRTGGGGDVPDDVDGRCREFGALVDPAECLANRELGCFASTKVTLGLDGIFAAGSVGAFDLGPVHWDNALVDFRLKIGEAPIFAISGGVGVDGLGSGELALKIELLPPKVEFHGYLDAFGAFEAQADGVATLGADVSPLALDGVLELHMGLRADFESFLRTAVADELRRISDELKQLEDALNLLEGDPVAKLREAKTTLQSLGVDIPEWVDGLLDAFASIRDLIGADATMPSIEAIFAGGYYTYEAPALRVCGLFQEYDPVTDRCIDGEGNTSEPGYLCPPFIEERNGNCVLEVDLPPLSDFIPVGLPASWDAALGDLRDAVLDVVRDVDLVPDLGGFSLSAYLDELAGQFEGSRFLTVDCAGFDWRDGEGAGEVATQIALTVLGQQYGLDVAFDFTNLDAAVRTVTEELLEFILDPGGEVPSCSEIGEQTTPPWLETLQTEAGTAVPPVLTLDAAGPVDEGQSVEVTGSITPSATDPIDITIEWGDGTSETLTDITGASFRATHTYADDDPSGTDGDTYTVAASSDGAAATAYVEIVVENTDPITTVHTAPGAVVAEGDAFELRIGIDDVASDIHSAVVDWGDGTVEKVAVAAPIAVLSHVFIDDDPTKTATDEKLVRVQISDDDRGYSREVYLVTVENVDPVVSVAGPAALPEGTEGEFTFTVSDAGSADTHFLRVDWGDGTSEARAINPSTGQITLTHTWVDDDPSSTPVDGYTVSATVRDDDFGVGQAAETVVVKNVAPNNVALTGPDAVDEGIGATWTVSFGDVGVEDTHEVTVAWGDGTSETVPVPAGASSVDVSHTYRDDDPTGSPADDYTVSVTVTDDDTGSTEIRPILRVRNIDPVVAVTGEDATKTITVQYSDPIGGDPAATFGITAYDVKPDTLTLTASFGPQGGSPSSGLPGWLSVSASPTCVDEGANHQTCTWGLNGSLDATSGIHTDIAPGTYEIAFTVTDDDGGSASDTLMLTVLPEDARVWYVGPTYAATPAARKGSTSIELRTTVRDITSAVPETDPAWDPWPGDIRNARVTFTERPLGPVACTAPGVDEVFDPFDVLDTPHSIGVASCSWSAAVPDKTVLYDIGTAVGGHYQRDSAADDATVTLARPFDDDDEGELDSEDGTVVLVDPAGVYRGDDGSRATFDFDLEFNDKGSKIKGKVTVKIVYEGRKYEIKTTAIDSIGAYRDPVTGAWHGEIEATATLTDVTNRPNKVTLGTGLTLQVRMTEGDSDDGGPAPTIGLSLWDTRRTSGDSSTQYLLISSSWDGDQTVLQTARGEIEVH